MRRTALLTALLAVCLTAAAQGWMYKDNKAIIASTPNYLTSESGNPSYLDIAVVKDNQGRDLAIGLLLGENPVYSFRDSQQYVVVSFDYEAQENYPIMQNDDGKFSSFFIIKPDRFINRLKTCHNFSVALPIYGHGVQTFIFSADGYPLDW